MHDRIISVAFEWDGWEFPGHPLIERIMHKQVGEDGTDHAPNAKGNFCFEVTLGYRRLELGR
jgi:hypothetical protein